MLVLYFPLSKKKILNDSNFYLQTLLSVLENAKEELTYLNKTGGTLVNDVDDQLVNSAPIQEQLAKLNATYKDILDRLEQEQIKLDIVSAHILSPAFLPLH